MNARVCYHYQKGECSKGEMCKFFHPKVKCRSFRSTGWCPYGFSCHFWHCPSDKRDNVELEKKPCQFFAIGQCKYGDKCSCSHTLSKSEEGTTLSEYKAAKELANLHIRKEKTIDVTTLDEHSALLSTRSTKLLKMKPDIPELVNLKQMYHAKSLEDVKNSTKDQCTLFESEMKRLVKMFPPSKLMELESYNDSRVFCLKFSSTDPDWVYYIREILLTITFPKVYPSLPFKATVLGQESLPAVLVQHLNSSISDWISLKHESLNGPNKTPTPYLKFFFHWLDRNLEQLFTEGLRKYKSLLNRKDTASERQDPSPERPRSSSSSSSVASFSVIEDSSVHLLKNIGSSLSRPDQPSKLGQSSDEELVSDDSSADEEDDDDSDDETESDDKNERPSNDYELIPSVGKADLDMTGLQGDVSVQTIPIEQPKKQQPSSPVDHKAVSVPLPVTPLETNPSQPAPSQPKTEPHTESGPGSQMVSLQDFKLCGKAGTFLPSHLSVQLHCTRCRLVFDWKFNLHGQAKPKLDDKTQGDGVTATINTNTGGAVEDGAGEDDSNTTSDQMELRLRSLPPHTTSCARCKQQLFLMFQASIAHAFENRIGTLHLNGCVADDIPSRHSNGILFCTECCNPVKIMNLAPGYPITRRCFNCHSLVGMEYSKFELKMLKEPDQNTQQKSAVPGAAKSSGETSRRSRRAMKKALKDPLLQEGNPLPLNGTCRHYDKSYRWLRFPCCGRLEPCILCHNKSATDGHVTEFATRMVCGFCSKEQAFSTQNPCVKCGKKLTGNHSSHWEGGRGCRNKLTMSKKDSKKYSDMNKTISKNKTSNK